MHIRGSVPQKTESQSASCAETEKSIQECNLVFQLGMVIGNFHCLSMYLAAFSSTRPHFSKFTVVNVIVTEFPQSPSSCKKTMLNTGHAGRQDILHSNRLEPQPYWAILLNQVIYFLSIHEIGNRTIVFDLLDT